MSTSINRVEGILIETVRVATFDGLRTRPKIQSMPRPKVPDKAALIRIFGLGLNFDPPPEDAV